MTKKDYELIASTIKETRGLFESVSEFANAVITNLANKLEQDNPRFDRNKFLEASGYKLN